VAFLLLILGCSGANVNPGTDCSYGGFRCCPQYFLEENFTSEISIGHVSFTSVSNLLSTDNADGPEILILLSVLQKINRIFMNPMAHYCAQHMLLESILSQTNSVHLFVILFVKIECSIISISPWVFKDIPSLQICNPKLLFVIFPIPNACCTLSIPLMFIGRFQWPCGLRRRSAGDRFLGSLVSNSAKGMVILLLGLFCVLYETTSATSRSLVRSPTRYVCVWSGNIYKEAVWAWLVPRKIESKWFKAS